VPLHTLAGAIWTTASRPQLADYSIKNQQPHLLQQPIPGFTLKPPSQEFYDLMTKVNPAVVTALFTTTCIPNFRDPNALPTKGYELRAAYDAALEKYDILLLPNTPVVGSKHPDRSNIKTLMELVVGLTLNRAPFNCTGHSALAMPVGRGVVPEGKLPLSMQLVGKRWGRRDIVQGGHSLGSPWIRSGYVNDGASWFKRI